MNTQDPPAPVQIGDLFAGKYVVDRVIGAGAMGVVVVATHAQLHEQVVLKFLRDDVAQRSDVVARFLREARSAVRIRNEHAARIIDVGTTDSGRPYIVMEYLQGCDLQELLRTRGSLTVEDAVDYVAQACLAMVEAHAAGIVHRDLKPSNLFLTHRSDGSSLVKVLDFGISKVLTDSSDQTDITSTNGILGSPIYISPEQAKCARSVDARADVWSLGVILHHLLAGRPPFIGDSITEVLSAILFSPPTRLREARPDAPPELESVILKCLDKDIEQRMPSAAKLAEALGPWTQPESRLAIARISSAPPPLTQPAAPLASTASPQDVAARTMMGWGAAGRRLRTPDLAKAVAAGTLLASIATGASYWAHRRSPIVMAPSVAGAPTPTGALPATSQAPSRAAAPGVPTASSPPAATGGAPSSDIPSLPQDRSAGAEPDGIRRVSRPSKSAPQRPAPAVSLGAAANKTPPPASVAAAANKTPPAATRSTSGIDPGILTFDLGVKPSNGQSNR